jgi:hypothetical protein
MTECAVWYMRYGASSYELCDDEAEAVSYAYGLESAEEGYVSGLQFADGRLIKRDDWQALDDYEKERLAAMRAAVPLSAPKPTRSIRDPFDGQTVDADVDEPSWLGA